MTFLLACCLNEYEIIFSVYKFIVCAEVKRKDSFPNRIDHFMQVTAERRLRWTFSFSGNHLEVCSFHLVNYYFSLPKNISSFNSSSPPQAFVTHCHYALMITQVQSLDSCNSHPKYCCQCLRVMLRNQRNVTGKVFRKLSNRYPSSETGSGAPVFLEHVKITYP